MSDPIADCITTVLRSPTWAFDEAEIPDFVADMKAALVKVDLVGEAQKLTDEAKAERKRQRMKAATDRYRARLKQEWRDSQLAAVKEGKAR